MPRPIGATLVAACCSLLAAGLADAQPGPGPGTLTLGLGLARGARVDEAISPVRYGGQGATLAVGYALAVGGMETSLRVDAGTSALVPHASAARGTQRLTAGAVELTVLRGVWDGADGAPLAAGLAIGGSMAHARHRYGGAAGPAATFRLAHLALGPAVAWRERLGETGGELRVTLAAPLLGVVDHPDRARRGLRVAGARRLVSVDRLQALRVGGTYVAPVAGRVAPLLSYRGELFRYRDVHAVRSLAHSVTVGVVVRGGRGGGA